jgi:hypothetical protein
MAGVDELLSRLDGVRASGAGWTARCPAHNDHDPSLSIASGDGGRVLIHCFAGCDTLTILEAVGLSMSDLFTERPKRLSRSRELTDPVLTAKDIITVLSHESLIVTMAASDICAGVVLSPEEMDRVALAERRLSTVRRRCGL